jgi:hypothetical protein
VAGAIAFLGQYSVVAFPWRLRAIGLDRTDAHHVLLAVWSGCRFFVSCDHRSLLKHSKKIGELYPNLRLVKPSEVVKEI